MKVNKLNIEDEITLDNGTFYLNIDKECHIKINVLENIKCKLFIVGFKDYLLNIKVLNNAEIMVNSLNKDNNVNINIELMEKAKIIYNHSVSAYNNSINKFILNHLENDSTSILNNNGINRNYHKLYFEIDGIIKKNLKNINCNQSSKIINFDKGDSKIVPNLIIDSNDIIANHSAYIGEIGEEELFFLRSRGIEDENIKKLIYKAVLLSKMESDEFNKLINEWW